MTKVFDRMTPSLKRIQKELEQLPREAADQWVRETPVDTGKARRSTSLVNKNTIWARYPYAKRLNEGHSKQAPDGMVPGTERFLRRRLRQILRK